MTRMLLTRRLIVGAVLAACTAMAAPAFAQDTTGSLKGRVLDPDGKPVAAAEVILQNTKDPTKGPLLLTTNPDGTFAQDLLPAGEWSITVKETKFTGQRKEPAVVKGGDKVDAGDIKMHVGTKNEMVALGELEKAVIAKHNEHAAKEQAAIQAADAARDAGNFDDAIAKYTDVAGLIDNCGACYVRIGDIYADKKNDPAQAEKAYLKAVDLYAASSTANAAEKAAPYDRLANIYNKEQKFDDASKMSAKANDLREASGGAGDPVGAYNQGVSLWNAQKFPEAQAAFQKAIKLDPKMSEAYYYLAMTLVNQNKLTEAKPNLETYLKLAPDGPNAATAKAVLDSIK